VALAPKDIDGQPAIGPAEYLDVLRACMELDVIPGDPPGNSCRRPRC
jgi:hypothetical protein